METKKRKTKAEKAAEAAFAAAMQNAAYGKLIPMLEIPRLWEEARAKVTAGEALETAAESVLKPYRKAA